MLSRKVVTRRGRRFRGYFPSRKLGRMVAWESLLERDAILLLEFSRGVVSYQEQPVRILYADGMISREYYPDFEAILEDRRCVHVEVKTTWQLAKPDIATKFKVIASDYRRRQQEFLIITEREIQCEPLLTNLRTLAYLAGRAGQILPSNQNLRELLGASVTSFAGVEAQLGPDLLLRLIAAGQIHCDLRQPLNGETPVWFEAGGSHATYLF